MLRSALTTLAFALALGATSAQGQDRVALDGSKLQPGRWLYTHYLLPASADRVDTTAGAFAPGQSSAPFSDPLSVLAVYVGPLSPAGGDTPGTARPPGRDTTSSTEPKYLVDSAARSLGPAELVITDTLYGGMPSWRLTLDGVRGGVLFADSLWVQRASLRPQHWGATIGLARLAAEFARDSIYAGASSPAGRHSLVAAAPEDLLVNEAMTDVVLRLLPLSAGRADSLTVLLADVSAIATPPARLTVQGEERVAVPAGVFDCWVVSLETERARATYWVAKDPQLVVKSEQVLPHMGGALLRRELVRR